MRIEILPLTLDDRTSTIKSAIDAGSRIGLITSIDGKQLVTLLLSPATSSIQCYETPLADTEYNSITPIVPQAHWFERTTWDMFGLLPKGHPRLKRTHLHEPYAFAAPPLAEKSHETDEHTYQFLTVDGEGLYEIPVGPIHAGIIEPGHFRFSCLGEIILNLEIRLGYVHRGVEKRLTEIPWTKARFVTEAAASDMPVANALAHATAMESLFEFETPKSLSLLRTMALEIERIAMHISDLGGLAGDIGFLAISSSMARMRGLALRMGEILAGNRFMRGLICPGGSTRPVTQDDIVELKRINTELSRQLKPIFEFYMDNQAVIDRMDGIGSVSKSLAVDFGLVGVAARASGVEYDCRKHWGHAAYPEKEFSIASETSGDVLARAKIRIQEITNSQQILSSILETMPSLLDIVQPALPKQLPPDHITAGIIESHRGELIHLIFTDHTGAIQRYCIKDSGVNNWTALSIAVRNNLVADFPLCNKSFSLSYSGHDV